MHKFIKTNSFISTKKEEKPSILNEEDSIKNTKPVQNEKELSPSKYWSLIKRHDDLLKNPNHSSKTNQ